MIDWSDEPTRGVKNLGDIRPFQSVEEYEDFRMEQRFKYRYKTEPYSHQKKALAKIALLDGNAGLFMEMGTGKTKVAIDWASIGFYNLNVRRIVVVCPLSVIPVWKRQIRQHSPVERNRIAVLNGNVESRVRLLKLLMKHPLNPRNTSTSTDQKVGLEWIILNYEGIWRENKQGTRIEDLLKKWKPDLVIADESHKIKAAMSKQSRSVYRLGQESRMRLCLTGTPITKSPLDVFGQFRFLNSGIFGTNWTSFKRTYGVWGGFGGFRLRRYKNLTTLTNLVRQNSYRIRKEKCLDLPEKVYLNIDVTLSDKAKEIYRQMAKQMIAEIEELEVKSTISATIVLTKILRLSQITSGFVKDTEGIIHDIGSEKLDLAIDLIRDMVEQDEKVVIFCRFRHDIDRITARLDHAKIQHAILSGSVPASKRDGLVQKFQKDPDTSVFVAQIAAGSLGIDLNAASLAIFYSWDYKWDQYVQAQDRLHRHGQTKKCTYYHLVVPGSIDTESLHILKEKGNLAHAILHDPNILRPKFK